MAETKAHILDIFTVLVLLILRIRPLRTDQNTTEDVSDDVDDSTSASTDNDVTSCFIEITKTQLKGIADRKAKFEDILAHDHYSDIINTHQSIQPIQLEDFQKQAILDNFSGFFSLIQEAENSSSQDGDEGEKRRRSLNTVSVCPTEDSTVAVGLAVDATGCLVQVIQLDIAEQLFPVQLCEEDDGLIPPILCQLEISLRKAYVLVLTDGTASFEIRDVCIPTCRAVIPLP